MYEIVKLRKRPELVPRASKWFSHCFGIKEKVYRKSMVEMLRQTLTVKEDVVPQWYIAMEGDTIIAGIGVIMNDYHDREDLAPNVCAVYTDEPYRGRGVARDMLITACDDMAEFGIDTLYLVTDLEGFYERYGWQFLCMVNGNDGESRMYVHHRNKDGGYGIER